MMTDESPNETSIPIEDPLEDVEFVGTTGEQDGDDPEQNQDAIIKDSTIVTPSSKRPFYILAAIVLLTLAVALIAVFATKEKKDTGSSRSPKHQGDNGKGTEMDISHKDDNDAAAPPSFTCAATNLMCPEKQNATAMPDWHMAVNILGEAAQDLSGSATALSCDGSVLAITAPRNDKGQVGITNSGHVRVYRMKGTTNWEMLGTDIDGDAQFDQFGTSVALSANGYRMAVGARFNDGGSNNAGHVRVLDYLEEQNQWLPVGDDIHGEDEDDQSGRSVSLSASGDRLAVGGTHNNATGTEAGHTRVFDYSATDQKWKQVGQDLDGEYAGDQNGRAVALSGDGKRVAVGAHKNDGGYGNITDTGHVRVFEYSEDKMAWTQLGEDIDGAGFSDWFGNAVSMSYDGSVLAVGAPGSMSRFLPGYSVVFQFVNGAWSMMGSNTLWGGYSVDMNQDGTRVVVGSQRGYKNGATSGHVITYDFNGTAWNAVGSAIAGDRSADFAGTSVAISADGMRVVSAAPGAGYNGTMEVGQVRIYDFC